MDKQRILEKFETEISKWRVKKGVKYPDELLLKLAEILYEETPVCNNCGADKTPVSWVCLECEWT